MMITVITVCLNSHDLIEKTIKSVLSQKDVDFEYIIQDGVSTDGTISIIERYNHNNRLSAYYECDCGLYDAMNKAVDKSRGDFVIFMNSGDIFYDEYVLRDVNNYLKITDDIVFGNAVFLGKENVVRKYSNHIGAMLMSGESICHQALFANRKLFLQQKFDLTYKIVSDYEFVVRNYKKKNNFKYINREICIFDSISGISSNKSNVGLMHLEEDMILKKYYPFIALFLVPLKKMKRIIC